MKMGTCIVTKRKVIKDSKKPEDQLVILLNVVYKIIARMMSNGLGHVLPNIFSDGQTFCIVGKDIAETLASIRDMTDIDEMKGYILKIIW